MHSSYFTVGFMIAGITSNILYRYHTRSDCIIHIKDKYSYTHVSGNNRYISSRQQFTIVDTNDKLYTIPYSVLSLQFDAEDKWTKLIIGNSYHIKYWGIRHPLLGLYPRIDNITEIKNDPLDVL